MHSSLPRPQRKAPGEKWGNGSAEGRKREEGGKRRGEGTEMTVKRSQHRPQRVQRSFPLPVLEPASGRPTEDKPYIFAILKPTPEYRPTDCWQIHNGMCMNKLSKMITWQRNVTTFMPSSTPTRAPFRKQISWQIQTLGKKSCRKLWSWLSGLVVSALGMRTRRPRFESRVAPLFHCMGSNLGQVVYTHCLPSFSAPRNWDTKGSFRRLSGYGDNKLSSKLSFRAHYNIT